MQNDKHRTHGIKYNFVMCGNFVRSYECKHAYRISQRNQDPKLHENFFFVESVVFHSLVQLHTGSPMVPFWKQDSCFYATYKRVSMLYCSCGLLLDLELWHFTAVRPLRWTNNGTPTGPKWDMYSLETNCWIICCTMYIVSHGIYILNTATDTCTFRYM